MASTVGVRELTQNASAVLREVKAGRTVTVTEHGRTIARILPAGMNPIEEAIANGQARLPSRPIGTGYEFKVPEPVPAGPSTTEIIADLRGYDSRLY